MSTPCYICQAPLTEIHVGADLKPLPCSDCLASVQDCLETFGSEEERLEEMDRREAQSLDEYLETKRKYHVL